MFTLSCLVHLTENSQRFDAFRSIFPAGTVSGAPKIKAIELVHSLERERRGVYAGAVGRWDFADDEMDVCIAIRTMVFKNGVAYLQAGGGIVYDSVEEDEYIETLNKLKGNMMALEAAEGELSVPHSKLGLIFALFRILAEDSTIQTFATRHKMRRYSWIDSVVCIVELLH